MQGFWGAFCLTSSNSLPAFLESNVNYLSNQRSKPDIFYSERLVISTLDKSNTIRYDKENQLICTGWVRLDNYQDLVLELGLSKDIDEVSLLFLAYRKWGTSILEHLLGDFSFVIYDAAEHRLLLAKDQLGIRPLFYTVFEDQLIFATQLDLIKRLLPIKPELNLTYIAKELKKASQEVGDTFFKSLYRLKPAHFISIIPGEEIIESKYWDLSPIVLPKLKKPEEYLDLVRSYFIRAVETRTRGRKKVGCQLSGGLDSSAIAVILSRTYPKQDLHTYSFVLDELTATYSDSGIDEKGTQEEIIQYADLLRENHHPVTRFHFKDVFEELETRNQVMGGVANSDSVWQDSLFKTAAENQGVEVMFSGFPGDEGISCPGGNYFYDYIYHKDLVGLVKHLLKFRRSALRGIYNYFRFKKLGTTKPDYARIQETRSTLNPALEKEFNLQDSSFAFKPSFKEWFKSQITRQHTCLRTESEGSYANRHGIDTVYPMADLRLIQLVYSLPVKFFAAKPYSRALFRNICKGILPEKVRTQPKFSGAKTLAFADYWIKTKYEQLQDYQLRNSLNLFISEEEYAKKQHENELMRMKRLNNLKEMDCLLEKNL